MFRNSTWAKILADTAVLGFVIMSAMAADIADAGVTCGVVKSKGGNSTITIREENGNDSKTFSPRWLGRGAKNGGGLDRAIVAKIANVPIGGTVRIIYDGGHVLDIELLAKPDATLDGNDGTFVGVMKAKGDTFIIVQGGDGDPKKFSAALTGERRDGRYDTKMTAAITQRKIGERVFVKWAKDKSGNAAMSELRPAKDGEKTTYAGRTKAAGADDQESGAVVGTVEDKGEVSISVKSTEGKTEHYVSRMIEGDDGKPGHLDADIIKTIAGIHMGATVQVNWTSQDKTKRITALKTVPRGTTQPVDESGNPIGTETSKAATQEVVKPAAEGFKDGDEGMLSGTVLERGETPPFVTIRTDEDQPRKLRFVPKWVGGNSDQGGGLDQAMQKIMANLKPGQKVHVKYIYQERLRTTSITVNK